MASYLYCFALFTDFPEMNTFFICELLHAPRGFKACGKVHRNKKSLFVYCRSYFLLFIRLYNFWLTCRNTELRVPEGSGFLRNALLLVSVPHDGNRLTVRNVLYMPYLTLFEVPESSTGLRVKLPTD